MYIVLANYSEDEADAIKLKKNFTEITIDGEEIPVGDILTLAPRQMKILRFNTPDEWREDGKNQVGFSQEALIG